jgi:hypothetical protein
MQCRYRNCESETVGRKWYCCDSHHWKEREARKDESNSRLGPVKKRTADFIYLRTGFQGYNRKGRPYGPAYTLTLATRENILKHFRTGENSVGFGDGKRLHGRELEDFLKGLNHRGLLRTT